MGQSKKHSALEAVVNVTTGLLLSIFIIQPIVFSIWDIHLTVGENTTIAIIFTIVSLVRGYAVRRWFNYIHHGGIPE